MSLSNSSSGTMLTRTLYLRSLGHVFFSVCSLSFLMDDSDFSTFFSIVEAL